MSDTISDVINYLERGPSYFETRNLEDGELERLENLVWELATTASNEVAWRKWRKEQGHD